MATSVGLVHDSSDLVKDYVCGACESKNIEESADYFCATCLKCFCGKCVYQHDQSYANHSKYGRGETKKWPLITKKMEDLLLKCDVHKDKNLETFCQDHSQLCCSACVLLNHRQCTNVTLICDSVNKMSLDMQQLSIDLHSILDELNKCKMTHEASMKSVEGSYSEKLQEIREQRKKLNAALDKLENTTLKELEEYRTTLKTSLKKDVDNCSRLKDELKQLSEAVQDLCDKSRKDCEFIASRKCMNKIQESKTYLKENPVKIQSSIIFNANIDIERFLSQQSSLGRIVDSMQSLTVKINPDQMLTVKKKSEYLVRMSCDTSQTFTISGICCLSNGQVIITDCHNRKVKLLDQHYNVTSHCDMSEYPWDMCQITSSEVAVAVGSDVQFISLSNGQLVNGRKFHLPHITFGIAFHQGVLYATSGNALYKYTLEGSLVNKLYEDAIGLLTVFKCAVSPAGDRIYVTNNNNQLITLARDGTLISTFPDPELEHPEGVHVTPSGQVLVCGNRSHTVMQVDHEGIQKLATLVSRKDGLSFPSSVCYNTNTHQIIVGLNRNNKIIVMESH